MNEIVAAAKAASEQRYPALNADDEILNYTRGQIRAMLRGAFQAGASWTLTRKDHQ